MENNETYGQFIKQRRKELSITQLNLAEKLNCTPQAISNYEKDKTNIYIGLIGPLCQILQVDITSFYNKKAQKNNDIADKYEFSEEKLSQSLLYLREKSKKSQGTVAKEIGITQTKLSKFESCNMLPNLQELKILSDYYKLSLEALYFGLIDIQLPNENTKPEKDKSKKKLFVLLSALGILVLIACVIIISLIVPKSSSSPSSEEPSNKPPLVNSFEVEQ